MNPPTDRPPRLEHPYNQWVLTTPVDGFTYIHDAVTSATQWLNTLPNHTPPPNTHNTLNQLAALHKWATAVEKTFLHQYAHNLKRDTVTALRVLQRRTERALGQFVQRGQYEGTIVRRGNTRAQQQGLVHPETWEVADLTDCYLFARIPYDTFNTILEEAAHHHRPSRTYLTEQLHPHQHPTPQLPHALAPQPQPQQPLSRAAATAANTVTTGRDQTRMIEGTIHGLAGITHVTDRIVTLDPAITSHQAKEWARQLAESRRRLERLITTLKTHTTQ